MNNVDFDSFIENKETKNHWWNMARRNILLSILLKYAKEDDKIVDMGCGTGYFLSKANIYFKDIIGVESYKYSNFVYENIIISDVTNTPPHAKR